MSKYLFIAVVVLSMLVGNLFSALQAERESAKKLKDSIYHYNKAMTKTAETVCKIREKVKYVYKDKDCNCYDTPIPSTILDILHKQ